MSKRKSCIHAIGAVPACGESNNCKGCKDYAKSVYGKCPRCGTPRTSEGNVCKKCGHLDMEAFMDIFKTYKGVESDK